MNLDAVTHKYAIKDMLWQVGFMMVCCIIIAVLYAKGITDHSNILVIGCIQAVIEDVTGYIREYLLYSQCREKLFKSLIFRDIASSLAVAAVGIAYSCWVMSINGNLAEFLPQAVLLFSAYVIALFNLRLFAACIKIRKTVQYGKYISLHQRELAGYDIKKFSGKGIDVLFIGVAMLLPIIYSGDIVDGWTVPLGKAAVSLAIEILLAVIAVINFKKHVSREYI